MLVGCVCAVFVSTHLIEMMSLTFHLHGCRIIVAVQEKKKQSGNRLQMQEKKSSYGNRQFIMPILTDVPLLSPLSSLHAPLCGECEMFGFMVKMLIMKDPFTSVF